MMITRTITRARIPLPMGLDPDFGEVEELEFA